MKIQLTRYRHVGQISKVHVHNTRRKGFNHPSKLYFYNSVEVLEKLPHETSLCLRFLT
jgi:hypothetical protein